MRAYIRHSIRAAALAALVAGAAAVAVSRPTQAESAGPAETVLLGAPHDPCFFEDATWSELTARDRDAWTELGWTQSWWDGTSVDDAPAVGSKGWDELSSRERTLLTGLGYSQASWENGPVCDEGESKEDEDIDEEDET